MRRPWTRGGSVALALPRRRGPSELTVKKLHLHKGSHNFFLSTMNYQGGQVDEAQISPT